MQNRPSRPLWIAAIVVSLVCVGGLAWGLYNYWNEPPAQTTLRPKPASGGGSGFGLGLMIGLGAGVVVGSLIALRKRQP